MQIASCYSEEKISQMSHGFRGNRDVPTAIQEVQQRIISEWLPSSGYEYAPAPDIEVYTAGDRQSADYRSEVWLPIIKKS